MTPRLYTVGQITLATVLGTFVGAGWCARANYVALGKRERGNVALAVGVVLTLALMCAAFVLPPWVPGPALLLPQIVIAATWAQTTFGADVERHEKRSVLAALGVGVVALVVVVAVLCGVGVLAE